MFTSLLDYLFLMANLVDFTELLVIEIHHKWLKCFYNKYVLIPMP